MSFQPICWKNQISINKLNQFNKIWWAVKNSFQITKRLVFFKIHARNYSKNHKSYHIKNNFFYNIHKNEILIYINFMASKTHQKLIFLGCTIKFDWCVSRSGRNSKFPNFYHSATKNPLRSLCWVINTLLRYSN